MYDLRSKLKRQIEIIGLVTDNPGRFTFGRLADLFHVDDETIKKDLANIRSMGIAINQVRGKGIRLTLPLKQEQLQELITQYIALSQALGSIEKSTRLLARNKGEAALSHIVLIQRCIEQSHTVIIDYQKDIGDLEEKREIGPLAFFQSEGMWRLLALHDGVIKQYHLSKIVSVKPTTKKFKRVSQEEIDDLFRYSWRSWLGKERHHIKLKISKEWADILKMKPIVEDQKIEKHATDNYTLEATVNSLEEVATWVVGKGGEVVVLEPEELRETVKKIIRAVNFAHKSLQ